MGLAPDLVGSAATATGDDIVAAGRFTLTGCSAATDSTVIGQRRGRGLRISRSAGVGALAAAGPAGAEQPIVIAVSSIRVYLLRAAGDERLVLWHTIDRRRVATTIHAHLNVRTVTIEDTWTGDRYELEGERSPQAHVTATMHALADVDELAS
ncbi:MAG TPA: hypothetical protein VFR26_10435 [Acidimicrobiales bacterium]|jgi:hypothetical protein|nr:hypothetical protein [Acidimicrobiales bacterium]